MSTIFLASSTSWCINSSIPFTKEWVILSCKSNFLIIPGLKPISTKKQLNVLPQRFYVDLPDDLIKSVIKCKNNDQIRQVGIEWCIEQSKELKKAGVPFLHYYTMGRSDNIKSIAESVF